MTSMLQPNWGPRGGNPRETPEIEKKNSSGASAPLSPGYRFWSGAPITDMGESSMLRPGENVPQCPSKLVTTHRWKVQSASASISSRTRAPAARRTRRMFLRYFPKPDDVTAGPGWIPSLLQARTGNIPPQSSLQKPLMRSTQTPSSSLARERSSPLKS